MKLNLSFVKSLIEDSRRLLAPYAKLHSWRCIEFPPSAAEGMEPEELFELVRKLREGARSYMIHLRVRTKNNIGDDLDTPGKREDRRDELFVLMMRASHILVHMLEISESRSKLVVHMSDTYVSFE